MTDDLPDHPLYFLILAIIIILAFLISFWAHLSTLKREEYKGSYNDLFLYSRNIPQIEAKVLASLIEIEYPIIECLIHEESKGNPEARGEAGEIGILQFMPLTFNTYCVERYGLENDIESPIIQVRCCNMMLRDGLGYHWTTYERCLKGQ